MVLDTHKSAAITGWVNFYQQSVQRPGVVLENSTVGTLSTDGTFVYAVEDFAVPPPPQSQNGQDFDPRLNSGYTRFGTGISDAMQHNRLQAYALESGKLRWELGGKSKPKQKAGPLEDCFFRGPPLPLEGRLYVLVEKKHALQLVCINPKSRAPGRPEVVSIRTVATIPEKQRQEMDRRTQALHLASADGLLVCPTNAGVLLAVNLLTNDLVWAYPYRDPSEKAIPEVPVPPHFGPRFPPGFRQKRNWHAAVPIIHDGLVVFTAPDAKAVTCVKLRDGARVWSQPRQDEDLYLGGISAGKVLLVGRTGCRALNLADGKQAWSLETGLPSGQGVLAGKVYYLPLRQSAQRKEAEIVAIDVARGQIVAHQRPRKPVVFGNLIFSGGELLSQTALAITSYPNLQAKLKQIDDKLHKNPKDPVGLTERRPAASGKGQPERGHRRSANRPRSETAPATAAAPADHPLRGTDRPAAAQLPGRREIPRRLQGPARSLPGVRPQPDRRRTAGAAAGEAQPPLLVADAHWPGAAGYREAGGGAAHLSRVGRPAERPFPDRGPRRPGAEGQPRCLGRQPHP